VIFIWANAGRKFKVEGHTDPEPAGFDDTRSVRDSRVLATIGISTHRKHRGKALETIENIEGGDIAAVNDEVASGQRHKHRLG
jgi:hypothetical protein